MQLGATECSGKVVESKDKQIVLTSLIVLKVKLHEFWELLFV
jgi:hypothetical protein